MLGTDTVLVHARANDRPAGRAHPRCGVQVGVAHTFGSQFVQVRGRHGRVAEALEVGAHVLAGDPENVGPGGGCFSRRLGLAWVGVQYLAAGPKKGSVGCHR